MPIVTGTLEPEAERLKNQGQFRHVNMNLFQNKIQKLKYKIKYKYKDWKCSSVLKCPWVQYSELSKTVKMNVHTIARELKDSTSSLLTWIFNAIPKPL